MTQRLTDESYLLFLNLNCHPLGRKCVALPVICNISSSRSVTASSCITWPPMMNSSRPSFTSCRTWRVFSVFKVLLQQFHTCGSVYQALSCTICLYFSLMGVCGRGIPPQSKELLLHGDEPAVLSLWQLLSHTGVHIGCIGVHALLWDIHTHSHYVKRGKHTHSSTLYEAGERKRLYKHTVQDIPVRFNTLFRLWWQKPTWIVYTQPTSMWLWGITNVWIGLFAAVTPCERRQQMKTTETTKKLIFFAREAFILFSHHQPDFLIIVVLQHVTLWRLAL